ncbi:MAG: GAF domain-containing sensor histidine kinase [Anaerolineales bacterium]|jgi:two-component system sensor histidine kinase DevS
MVTRDENINSSLTGSAEAYSNLRSDMVALHRATLSLFSDLSLEGVLRRVIHAARELSDARYAALGIPDSEGGLETFITLGLTRDEIEHIEHQPRGDGLIGEMMRTGQSIRIAEIEAHPRSVGFPPGHPQMHSFLGVPISAYGRPLGQIYLTDKLDAQQFTLEDQRLIEMLAAHAAAAIENARLYQKVLENESELSDRNEELGLMYSLATAVSSSMELDRLLEVMLQRVMKLFHAGAGEIFLLEEQEGVYQKAIHLGDAPQAFWEIDRFRPGEGLIGKVAQEASPRWTTELTADEEFLRKSVLESGFKTLVGVPLTAPGKVTGVLTLAFRTMRTIQEQEAGLLGAVGAGVGIAVENARLYRQARRVAVLEERERIGMDLHDGVIQSIYATGLTLEYARMDVQERAPEAADRISQAIKGLNKAIRDIRSYILDLQPSRISTDDLPRALGRLVREFKANTLVETDLIIEPEALERLNGSIAADLFHISQEALANIAKHAKATRTWITVRETSDNTVTLQVIDNGWGFDMEGEPELLGHGLSNMTERARIFGGELTVDSSPGEGTTITVRIPSDKLS